jgi:nucleotide-binding universal stress UspA family protein
MSRSTTVVFGDDGSTSAERAFAWVAAQHWDGWALEIVHAVMPEIGPPIEPALASLHEWRPPEPRALADSVGFSDVRHLTAIADPRLALMHEAGLVVIGPRGTGVWKSLHLGSVAEWLVSRPVTPVAVIKDQRPVTSTLCAYDCSRHADAALRAYLALPWSRSAGLDVLIVADGRVDPAAAEVAVRAAVGERAVNIRHQQGHPTAALFGVIDREQPGLVVIGDRGLTGWSRMLIGSTATAVLREAPVSVMVAGVPAAA